MKRLLQDLQDAQWLNNSTQVVLVQFTTFNPTTSLFAISLLAFEFLDVGVVDPCHDIDTCKLYSFANMRDAVTILCEIAYLVLILLYINRAIRSFLASLTHLRRYLLSVWTYVDWVIIALVYAAVAVFIFRFMAINNVVSLVLKHRKRYLSFKKAASYGLGFSYILAASITMFVIKSLNLLYVSKRTLLQTSKLKRNMKYISIYAAGIVPSSVSGIESPVRGEEHSRVSTSLMTTARLIWYKSNFDDNGCVTRSPAVDFVFHSVVTRVLLPCMITHVVALIVITASCNYHFSHLQEKTEFVDFLFS